MDGTNIFCFFIEFQRTSKICASRPEYSLKAMKLYLIFILLFRALIFKNIYPRRF